MSDPPRTELPSDIEFWIRRVLTDEGAEQWLHTPAAFLQGRTPYQAIQDGDGDHVRQALSSIDLNHD
jgi:hypothetical protein